MGLGGAGESKTLALGFAMAPHRLRALVAYVCSDVSCVIMSSLMNTLTVCILPVLILVVDSIEKNREKK